MLKKLLKTLKKKLNNTAKLYRKTDSNNLESVFCFVNQSVWDKAFFNFQTAIFLYRLKALVSTKFNLQQKAINQTNRVRAYRTHPTRWF